tara:strand:+ start:3960 stop:5546 length:1587 start_codon:yes stop_codon:yes gene_type:complete
MNKKFNFLKNFKTDLPSSMVVFLVALPLCLGIALASGAPLYAGLISGVIGGIVVGVFSGSKLGVSGPAAGLAVIVLNAITDLGSFEVFLVALVLAGFIQIIMGFAKAGIIAYYFPSSVIHGMLAGIGIIIVLKQIPHAFGYDKDPEGNLTFMQTDSQNTFSELFNMIEFISPSVVIITITSLIILLLWQSKWITNNSLLKQIPGPLLAVMSGIGLNLFFSTNPEMVVSADHLVSIPVSDGFAGFIGNFTFPNFAALTNPQVYITAVVIAVVASLETLLCVEATDKLDPNKNVTPTNLELKAQGVGNIVSGLLGGLPITQVIVRSSANIQAGGKSKLSAILHGVFLILTVVAIPKILNLIPLGTLAAILLIIGFKLAKPSLFLKMYVQGKSQFIPFVVTILGIVFTDLLTGIGLGLIVATFVILRNNYKVPFIMQEENVEEEKNINIKLAQSVTFLNKASLLKTFANIPDNSTVTLDAADTYFIHQDVLEIIEDFKIHAVASNIKLDCIELYEHKELVKKLNFQITDKK